MYYDIVVASSPGSLPPPPPPPPPPPQREPGDEANYVVTLCQFHLEYLMISHAFQQISEGVTMLLHSH
jgi:hypothetical protein